MKIARTATPPKAKLLRHSTASSLFTAGRRFHANDDFDDAIFFAAFSATALPRQAADTIATFSSTGIFDDDWRLFSILIIESVLNSFRAPGAIIGLICATTNLAASI